MKYSVFAVALLPSSHAWVYLTRAPIKLSSSTAIKSSSSKDINNCTYVDQSRRNALGMFLGIFSISFPTHAKEPEESNLVKDNKNMKDTDPLSSFGQDLSNMDFNSWKNNEVKKDDNLIKNDLENAIKDTQKKRSVGPRTHG